MRFLRYILVPWTMVLVYTFFSFFLGQNGVYARKHLEAEQHRLSEHQKTLEYVHNDLVNTKNNLIHDNDSLTVYSRQLGNGHEKETFYRVLGLSVAVAAPLPENRVLYSTSPEYVSDRLIKIISACFGLAVLAFFLISAHTS